GLSSRMPMVMSYFSAAPGREEDEVTVEEEARGGAPDGPPGALRVCSPGGFLLTPETLCLISLSWPRSLSSPCSALCPGRRLRLPRPCRRISETSTSTSTNTRSFRCTRRRRPPRSLTG